MCGKNVHIHIQLYVWLCPCIWILENCIVQHPSQCQIQIRYFCKQFLVKVELRILNNSFILCNAILCRSTRKKVLLLMFRYMLWMDFKGERMCEIRKFSIRSIDIELHGFSLSYIAIAKCSNFLFNHLLL